MDPQKPWSEQWINQRPFGGGGQGDTFLVQHTTGDPQQAVLKLLKVSKRNDGKARRRMYHEVANLRTLADAGANVPRVFDGNTERFKEAGISLYFVMEYVSGETLDKIVQSQGKLSFEQSVRIALALCATLKIAFKETILHRDIKPNNLMVRNLDTYDIVMLDFGLSFNEDEQGSVTDSGEALDNSFLSLPERRGAFENKRNVRSDITSVCAILFYCLTGIAPRNLRNSEGFPPHRWKESKEKLTIAHPAKQSLLLSLLDKGLSYEIVNRFQTIDELDQRLKELLQPGPWPPDQDIVTIAKQHGQALYEVDPRTRLAAYRTRASALDEALDKFIKMGCGQLHPFLVFHEDPNQRRAERDQTSDVSSYSAFVHVREHRITCTIKYTISVASNECLVYRQLALRWPNNRVESHNPVLVHRYLVEAQPDCAYLVKDLEAGIGEAIAMLCEKIKKGYQEG